MVMRLTLTNSLSGGVGQFTPAIIPNLERWYDASDASTITETGGSVNQWDDKSTNGNNATQANGVNQPQTGVSTVNGLNVLSFNGTSQSFTMPALGSPATLFMVMSAGTGQSSQSLMGGFSPSTFLPIAQDGATSTEVYRAVGTPTLHIDGVLNTPTTRDEAYDAYIDGTNKLIRYTNLVSTDLSLLGQGGSSSFYHNGIIAEVIVVSGTPSAQTIADTEAYLTSKWSI